MTAETLLALAERCEREEATFALDRQIMYAVFNVAPAHRSNGDKPKPYTTSLDAAVWLVPPDHWWRVDRETNNQAEVWPAMTDDMSVARADTPALALCAAALRARAALLETKS